MAFVVVKSPFASNLKYKARPFICKASIVIIKKDFIVQELGKLDEKNIERLKTMIGVIC